MASWTPFRDLWAAQVEKRLLALSRCHCAECRHVEVRGTELYWPSRRLTVPTGLLAPSEDDLWLATRDMLRSGIPPNWSYAVQHGAPTLAPPITSPKPKPKRALPKEQPHESGY